MRIHERYFLQYKYNQPVEYQRKIHLLIPRFTKTLCGKSAYDQRIKVESTTRESFHSFVLSDICSTCVRVFDKNCYPKFHELMVYK